MSNSTTIFAGNFFDIDYAGGEWAIWRITGDEGGRERLILTQDAMDELADYFADCFAEDREQFGVKRVGDDV